ncbi:MAG: hypothetical protein ACOC7N_00935 [Chloroflexota bacterium]
MSIAFVELAIVGLVSLVSLVIPTATLVVAILIYAKLGRIERALTSPE